MPEGQALRPFEYFVQEVREFWPDYQTTDKELRTLFDGWAYRYGSGALSAAFARHKNEEPDNRRPTWKTIRAILAHEYIKGDRPNDWRCLLNLTRQWLADLVSFTRNADDLTDAEVWSYHLGNLCNPIIRRRGERLPDEEPCPVCKQHGEDCGLGRRECLARRTALNERDRWRRYHEDRREEVPACLLDGS